jgi:Ras GTPase-activating-like protein IQGAP2/3
MYDFTVVCPYFANDVLSPSTPETFDIVTNTISIDARKNLAQISKVLTQITSGSEFGEESPSYLPINEFVRKTIAQMSAWLIEGNGPYC